MVHREIKPDNIHFSPEGDIKIADLSLVSFITERDEILTRLEVTNDERGVLAPEIK